MTWNLTDLTWEEFRYRVPSQSDSVIVPVGTIEAHGAIPLGTDNLIPARLAQDLAPAARLRARIVPNAPEIDGRGPHPGCTAASPRPQTSESAEGSSPTRRAPRTRNSTWSELMRRVFAVDVLECPHCHGRMRILAAIHPPDTTRKILEHLGLPSRAPPIAPAVSEPEPAALEADFID